MPYPGLLHPEPLQQATDDLYLHKRHSDTVLAQSLCFERAFCAFPRSEQLRWPGVWRVHCPGSQPFGFLVTPQKHQLMCVVCLFWRADPILRPSWQMSTIQDLRKTYITTGKTIVLTIWIFVSKLMSLFFNMLSSFYVKYRFSSKEQVSF